MDTTSLAAGLLEPVPANRLFGIRVRSATPEGSAVELEVRPELGNVIGSLHASGLVALLDAAGLAAVIGALPAPDALDGVQVLGATAEMRFLVPATGTLVGRCTLTDDAARALARFFRGTVDRLRVDTAVTISDAADVEVCTGSFQWSVKRPRGVAPAAG